MHRYNSVEEIEADKAKLLEELGMSEEDATDLYNMNILDYSAQCLIERVWQLNFLIKHGR